MSSRIVPVFPGLWWGRGCGVAFVASPEVEMEEELLLEVVLVGSTERVSADGAKGEDSSDDFEKNPAINTRLRMFHIV